MFKSPVVMTGMLGAAVAAPIAMTEAPKHLGGEPAAASVAATSATPGGAVPPAPVATPLGPGGIYGDSSVPLEGAGFVSLADLLRMDVSKEWVYTRWARKSTGLADPKLFGVRAPVVTGTMMTDLAGSISYYFNAQGRCDRIRFYGHTADPSAVVNYVQRQYGLRPAGAMPGEQVYKRCVGGKTESELRTRPDGVLWSNAPHGSYLVELEINRPGTGQFVQRAPVALDLPPATPDPAATAAADAPAEAASKAAEPAAAEESSSSLIPNARRPTYRWPN